MPGSFQFSLAFIWSNGTKKKKCDSKYIDRTHTHTAQYTRNDNFTYNTLIMISAERIAVHHVCVCVVCVPVLTSIAVDKLFTMTSITIKYMKTAYPAGDHNEILGNA